MEKNKYSKNLNKYEQLYFLIEDYAKEYANLLEDKDNRTNENRCERYYKKVHDFVRQELDKAREEGRESIIAELSISENMEKVERFFREAPIDYDDKCNLWNGFLSKLKQ
jgi:hypothetical protein